VGERRGGICEIMRRRGAARRGQTDLWKDWRVGDGCRLMTRTLGAAGDSARMRAHCRPAFLVGPVADYSQGGKDMMGGVIKTPRSMPRSGGLGLEGRKSLLQRCITDTWT